MRLCCKCNEARIEPETDRETEICRACELERQAAERPLLPDAPDLERAEAFIGESGWRLAKTMLDIPHQYTVRDLGSPDAVKTTARDHSSFEWFVRYVRDAGVRKRWGPHHNTYLIVDEWEYWTMGYPVEDTTVINRQAVGPVAKERIDAEVREALLGRG
jgi:hypothetical protein